MGVTDVSKALEEAKALVAALESYDGSEKAHLGLLNQATNVRSALETPTDTCTRWLENLSAAGAMHILVRTRAITKLSADASIGATELARECNLDASVITRCMRILLLSGIFEETAPDEYRHNGLSQAFLPEVLGTFVCMSTDFVRTWGVMPEYAKTHAPEDLYDLKKTPINFLNGHEGMTFYEALQLDEEERHLWNLTLQAMSKGFPIVGMFPFRDLEEQVTSEPDRPFIVDMGGGRGQALLELQEHCGGSYGSKLILQDLPIVIDSLSPEEIPGIEPMKHDVFTPQPVKNAHVYFMRRLLHDFYDPECLEILRNLVPAMGPSSRLIISDMLLPDLVVPGDDRTAYWLDLCLLCIGGRERKLREFEAMFAEVGLELVQVHRSSAGHVAMLETRVKRE
ncbi:S-adenosyl-L-methionine-dependent methyltransferase [Stachybotrys elegans]|uniref:S-adenosyl-L-methionine-dependent methyltransferase n=1 Tax=Stachybotrys elegans TaxID=80388 RepID=A0A8K0WNM8_9HYPO|nr:S-adenosyl-L-methionine-dependent methyltransferase [Stachybotrys elegans]